MTAKIFYDTNILVYAFSSDHPRKKEVALDLIESGMRYGIGVYSTQVINEFIAVMTSKASVRIPIKQMKEHLGTLSGLELVEIDMPQIFRAIECVERYQVSYWDALMIASAEKAGCRTFLTEDLNPGQKIGSIQIVNPFLK